MSGFFAILFLTSTSFLVWGLITPKNFSKFAHKPITRKDLGLGMGLVSFVFFMLTGLTAPPKANVVSTQNQIAESKSQNTSVKKTPIKSQPIVKTITSTVEIPYQSITINDTNMPRGQSAITTAGVNGVKTINYQVTVVDGIETSRKVLGESITTPPINEVNSVGTKEPVKAVSNCNVNYSGCVPNASDVDCAGGSGNGPAYTYGPVRVIGYDVYGLDRDNDGYGCE